MNDTEKAERDIYSAPSILLMERSNGARRREAERERDRPTDRQSERARTKRKRPAEDRGDRNLNPEVIILIGPN